MKKIFKIISVILFIIISIIIIRAYFIDYALVDGNKFSPDVKQGELVFICKICTSYEAGDLIIVIKDNPRRNVLTRVESVVDSKTIKVNNGEESIEMRVENISGKLF